MNIPEYLEYHIPKQVKATRAGVPSLRASVYNLAIQSLKLTLLFIVVARRRRKESRPRRQRTTFSAHQTLRLELEYARGEYVARARR